jgi:hypothetical protein
VRSRLATSTAAAAVTAALVLAPTAAAENYQYKVVAKDKAAAAAAVLKRGDLGGLPGWSGGAVPPDRTPETDADRCNGYLPKQSDLVVTGDAETKYSLQGTTIDTQVQLLRTPAMVTTDWHRSIEIPDYVSCAKEQFQKQLPKNEHFISLTKLPYSTFGTKSVAYRSLFDVVGGGRKIRVAVDFIGFYRGRTEVSVIISGAAPTASDLMALKALDLKVADIVNGKVPAA